ncbi:multidrug ABC transporter ATP-binding protein [Exiguobacterium sp. Leaf187]|uniref:ABC transporter ATP-binding protein n=1 Tax=Exiguobacterium acetylicum TaxID=41170 RepID=A0ABX8GE26_EXIAC|nr:MULTISPECIES: ABC transporter ATP-binding protein [Exiguobacterium]AOT00494.1 multidrug ABC transporter ATP-binding protein [Exiguobacterium sp. U13-1]KQS18687.1 multidrug ABC transporter ATP-binding protein [Exiguobacterium sp. Leaf187]QWB31458.1 ABC transporter ATP-binding protein [Exiguobacterium acetylicum]
MEMIKLEQVTKGYQGNPLFADVDLTIQKGDIVGITGPNGSGKSVLFKMICGFIHPDAGTITVRNEQLGPTRRFPENVGVIIDRPGYIAHKSGFENLKQLAAIRKVITDADIEQAMRTVGLQPGNRQKVKQYSLGMKQKLAIAQAIMEQQDILILDEAFNALDHDSVLRLRELLLSFKKEGKTIILTSHNQQDIDALCDSVYRINQGRLEQVG